MTATLRLEQPSEGQEALAFLLLSIGRCIRWRSLADLVQVVHVVQLM